jgi:hypothetical protein
LPVIAPLVVFSIVPPSPTTQPVSESKKYKEVKYFKVPLFCDSQFLPPSLVFKMTPLPANAQPVLALEK